ncbi:diaminopimelate epimerase [Bacillus sp. SD075]|uniref:diaminopimelate epimerase n=1 Tax=Bacillus sp. SD075 TaxID=2781732 RepID=UPI001A960443|nr:diaminopimelate epimerase [Bacillus sp. SD075]MBO0997509.1 diaminopimelate epimerase [Bacillus sp. SD075]
MIKEIDFVKFNPTQNMTVLVKTNHPDEEYKQIASKIMSYDSLNAEQVGFIEKSTKKEAAAHLKMAGGEFCGNACMSLATLIASEKGLNHNHMAKISLEVSGADKLIMCQVKKKSDEYYCQVTMPIPKRIEKRKIKLDGSDMEIIMVNYGEFVHIVMEVEQFNRKMRENAEKLAKLIGSPSSYNLIGILLYKSKTHELAPLIYVPHLDSLIWERGCGSGTATLGAYLAWKNNREITAQIKQPGGIITVFANYFKEELTRLEIEGSVGIVAQGKAFIEV